MPYLGVIKTGFSSRQISLSEFYKMSQMIELTFCCCKGYCGAKQCRCFAASKLCSSPCKNFCLPKEKLLAKENLETNKMYSNLKAFGGGIKINNGYLDFLNTCATDAWIAIFHAIFCDHVQLQQKAITHFDNSFLNLLDLIN